MIKINDTEILGPRALSNMCETVALRVSKLDARYRVLIEDFMSEMETNGDTDQAKRIGNSMMAIQQEIKEIHQKVRVDNAKN